jgi:hypothetical protein
MDPDASEAMQRMGLPVFHDPELPLISSKSAQWADPKFHALVCTKLIPVLRALRMGYKVLLSDADVVFLSDPTPFFREDVSMTFSIGSCHRELPENFHFTVEGIEKLNTGFYYVADPSEAIVSAFSRALAKCRSTSMIGDQPAINAVLQEDWTSADKGRRGGRVDYSYAFFDGCLFANGCIYFKHLCANATYSPQRRITGALTLPARSQPVMVHANFLVGRKEKIKHLKKYGLWDEQCIAHWRSKMLA